jgi:hypothetical protein
MSTRYKPSPNDVHELNRIREKVDGISGDGVANGPRKITIKQRPSAQFSPPVGLSVIPVICDKTGGVAGNKTTMCSFTYTIYRLDGTTVIATGVAVLDNGNRKAVGAYEAGTRGLAFRNGSGTWELWYVSEKAVGNPCP